MSDLIIKNLEKAIELVEAYPEELFNLSVFSRRTACGTLFCTLGLLASNPYFVEQGLKLEDGCVVTVDPGAVRFDLLNTLFGGGSYDLLFDIYLEGLWDDEILGITERGGWERIPDKALALARLNKQLEIYRGTTET